MAELPLPAGLDARTFPAKLWRLANSPRVRSVRWDSQGRGLLIDRARFEQELLSSAGVQGPAPRTFRATQFRSIVRQLNRYGFYKVPGRAGAAVPGGAGAIVHYGNPWFRRDRPHLLLRIRRRSTASKHRLAPGPERRRRSPCGSQQQELPSADLGLQVEAMIREIRRSVAERSPFAQVTPLDGNEGAGLRAFEHCCKGFFS
uniref:Uncharacterized protein n=1 Tax=Corvus moneduloides TaxID=1196302 RepID=A0A8U7NNV6_CORMO